jgi:hypothetical protein
MRERRVNVHVEQVRHRSSPPPVHPARWLWFVRRRQVSWLTAPEGGLESAAHRRRPGLPEPSGPVTRLTRNGRRRSSFSPLTVAGAAADLSPDRSVQPGRTAFPFHPLARDHRHIRMSLYDRNRCVQRHDARPARELALPNLIQGRSHTTIHRWPTIGRRSWPNVWARSR